MRIQSRALALLFLSICQIAPATISDSDPLARVPSALLPSDTRLRELLREAAADTNNAEYQAAHAKLEQAFTLSKTIDSIEDRAKAEGAFGNSENVMGRIESARTLNTEARSLATQTDNVALQAELQINYSTCLRAVGKNKEAEQELADAVEKARNSKELYVLSQALGELGGVRITLGDLKNGIPPLQEALEIERLNHYDFAAVHLMYDALAIVGSDIKGAHAKMNDAMETAKAEQNYVVVDIAAMSLAGIYTEQKDFPKASTSLSNLMLGRIEGLDPQQQRKARSALDIPAVKIAYLKISSLIYRQMGDVGKADLATQELLDYAKAHGMAATEADATFNMAESYRAKNDPAHADVLYTRSADLWQGLGELQQADHSLGADGDMLLNANNAVRAKAVIQRILDNVVQVHDEQLAFVAWRGFARACHLQSDWAGEKDALVTAESLYLAHPTGFAAKDILNLYVLLATNASNLKDAYLTFLVNEKALVVAAHFNDQDLLRLTVPYVEGVMKVLKLEEDSQKLLNSHNPEGVLYDEELLAAYDINAPKWKDFKGNPKTVEEHYARIFELTKILLDKATPQKDFDDLYKLLGPIDGSFQAAILSGFVSHSLQHDPKAAEQSAITAIEGNWSDFNESPRTRAWLTCFAGQSALLTQDKEHLHSEAFACMKQATELHDQNLISLAHNLRAFDEQASVQDRQESWKRLADIQPKNPFPHNRLGWIAYERGQYDEAIRQWQDELSLTDDPAAQIQCYTNLATAFDSLNTPDSHKKASEQLNFALGNAKKLNDGNKQIHVTLLLAEHEIKTGNSDEARHLIDGAINLARQSKDQELLGEALAKSGQIASTVEDYQRAYEDESAAAREFENQRRPDNEAFNLYFAAEALYRLRQYDQAEANLLKAVSIADASGTPLTQYWMHRDVSTFLLGQGDFVDGLQQIKIALAKSHEVGDRKFELWALESLAEQLPEVGEWEEAAAYAQSALKLAQQLDLPEDEAEVYENLLSIYGDRRSDIKNLDAALRYYHQAKNLVAQIHDPNYHHTSMNISEVLVQTKNFDEGITLERENIENCRLNKDPQCEAHSWMSLSEMYRGKGDMKAARTSLAKAVPLADRAQDFYTSGRLIYTQAGQALAEGDCSDAVTLYEDVVGYIEKVRAGSNSEQDKSIGETYSLVYDELQKALYCLSEQKPKSHEEIGWSALRYAETNKANAFTHDWGQIFLSEIRKDVPASLLEQERNLTVKRESLEEELLQKKAVHGTARDPQVISSDLSSCEKALADLIQTLRAQYPKYAEIKYPQAIDPRKLSLTVGEVALDMKVTDSATFLWILTNRGNGTELADYYRINRSREWIDSKIASIREPFVERSLSHNYQDLEDLSSALFPAAVQHTVFSAKHLTVIPDGTFYLLPFEIVRLPDGKYPLSNAVSYEPSLSALSVARANRPEQDWPEAYLGYADPIVHLDDAPQMGKVESAPTAEPSRSVSKVDLEDRGFSLERLPQTATEVNEIASLFEKSGSKAEVRLGDAATKESLLATDLNRFRFLHFATHGVAPTVGKLREPALVFSYHGSQVQQVLLPVSEIAHLKMNSEMVTLSACNTGSGHISRSEGVMNLGRAFLLAGAKNVTVSLWSVSDDSTSKLMQEFYREIQSGKSRSEALAGARAMLRSDSRYSDPYYWAPFILVGE